MNERRDKVISGGKATDNISLEGNLGCSEHLCGSALPSSSDIVCCTCAEGLERLCWGLDRFKPSDLGSLRGLPIRNDGPNSHCFLSLSHRSHSVENGRVKHLLLTARQDRHARPVRWRGASGGIGAEGL